MFVSPKVLKTIWAYRQFDEGLSTENFDMALSIRDIGIITLFSALSSSPHPRGNSQPGGRQLCQVGHLKPQESGVRRCSPLLFQSLLYFYKQLLNGIIAVLQSVYLTRRFANGVVQEVCNVNEIMSLFYHRKL